MASFFFSESVLDGTNLCSFSQLSCEKLKRFAPSEAVPSFLDGVTVVPLEITFKDNGGNIFILDEFIGQMNSYI